MATRDGYYFIDITWKSGFKHTVPCRGYNLKSEIAFNDSIFWIDSFIYYEVTKEQYEEKVWGAFSTEEIEKPKKRSSAATTRKTKDGTISKPKRTAKARPIAKESKEASTKVTRAKRSTTQDGKQDGKRSVAPNKRKPKPAT